MPMCLFLQKYKFMKDRAINYDFYYGWPIIPECASPHYVPTSTVTIESTTLS